MKILEKNTSFRKGVSFVIVVLIILPCILSVSAKHENAPINNGSIFNFQSILSIGWSGNDTAEPIRPGEVREVSLDIFYVVVGGCYFWKIFDFFLEGREMTITLSIDDKSEWCTAHVEPGILTGTVSSDMQYTSSLLTIQLNEGAPLNYSLGYVKIRGVIEDMKGPFRMLTIIEGFNQRVTCDFVTAPE